jgi:protein-tyrosine-phosphatase
VTSPGGPPSDGRLAGVPDRRRPDPPDAAAILVLCTGNAARSVMAGAMLARLAEALAIPLRVATAGTHALEGQPASVRTQEVLAGMGGLGARPLSAHRSRQLDAAGLERADLVVAMEADHVRYVRRRFPEAAPRTATLRRLCRDLPLVPPPLADRVRALGLAEVVPDDAEDVPDPAGGDRETYARCAAELWELCQELAARL